MISSKGILQFSHLASQTKLCACWHTKRGSPSVMAFLEMSVIKCKFWGLDKVAFRMPLTHVSHVRAHHFLFRENTNRDSWPRLAAYPLALSQLEKGEWLGWSTSGNSKSSLNFHAEKPETMECALLKSALHSKPSKFEWLSSFPTCCNLWHNALHNVHVAGIAINTSVNGPGGWWTLLQWSPPGSFGTDPAKAHCTAGTVGLFSGSSPPVQGAWHNLLALNGSWKQWKSNTYQCRMLSFICNIKGKPAFWRHLISGI